MLGGWDHNIGNSCGPYSTSAGLFDSSGCLPPRKGEAAAKGRVNLGGTGFAGSFTLRLITWVSIHVSKGCRCASRLSNSQKLHRVSIGVCLRTRALLLEESPEVTTATTLPQLTRKLTEDLIERTELGGSWDLVPLITRFVTPLITGVAYYVP